VKGGERKRGGRGCGDWERMEENVGEKEGMRERRREIVGDENRRRRRGWRKGGGDMENGGMKKNESEGYGRKMEK
jgi:hypothetical protein